MLNKSKCFGLLMGAVYVLLGISPGSNTQASTPSISEELYSENLYLTRSSAEIPSAFESSAREVRAVPKPQAAQQVAASDVQMPAVAVKDATPDFSVESIAELDAPATKKKSKR